MMMIMLIVKMFKLLKFSTGEALTMLDRLINLKEPSNEEKNSLVSIKDKL